MPCLQESLHQLRILFFRIETRQQLNRYEPPKGGLMRQIKQSALQETENSTVLIEDSAQIEGGMFIERYEMGIECHEHAIETLECALASDCKGIILTIELELEKRKAVNPAQFGDGIGMSQRQGFGDGWCRQKGQVFGADARLGADEAAGIPADQAGGADEDDDQPRAHAGLTAAFASVHRPRSPPATRSTAPRRQGAEADRRVRPAGHRRLRCDR